MLSRDEVIWGYRFVLGRDPESDPVIEMQRQHFNTIGEFRKSLLNSPEFNLQTPVSNDTTQYLGYRAEDLGVFEAFGSAAPEPMAGFVTDFHGSRARVSSLWDGVQHLDGVVLPIPVPGDYHADTAEWLGVLKAVLAADNRFAAMELGAGMGPWLVAGAVAARIRGIDDIRLLGVEGDPDRFALMQQNFRDNRIDPNEHTLICGGVGVRSGKAKWPRIADFRNVSGARPVRQGHDIAENPDRGDLNYLEGIVGDELIDINIVAFDELLTHQPLWDLVHIDVQGTEVELCTSCLAALSQRVRYLVVGTHSRKLDGDLLELMFRAGWNLEHEKPAHFTYNRQLLTLERMTAVDGLQVWRNPSL